MWCSFVGRRLCILLCCSATWCCLSALHPPLLHARQELVSPFPVRAPRHCTRARRRTCIMVVRQFYPAESGARPYQRAAVHTRFRPLRAPMSLVATQDLKCAQRFRVAARSAARKKYWHICAPHEGFHFFCGALFRSLPCMHADICPSAKLPAQVAGQSL
ncbi:hypothetical protein DFH06DRAFT_1154832, partial [Mycena polygramma]